MTTTGLTAHYATIDLANSSGVAIWHHCTLVTVINLTAPTHRQWREALAGCSTVIVEGMVNARRSGARSKATTAANHRLLADAADELGAKLIRRSPQAWRSRLGIKNNSNAKQVARSQLRALVRTDPTLAPAVDAANDPDPGRLDEVEAVMIGVSWQVERGWRGRDGRVVEGMGEATASGMRTSNGGEMVPERASNSGEAAEVRT